MIIIAIAKAMLQQKVNGLKKMASK